MTLGTLLEALKAEFAGDVAFYAHTPANLTAPAVVVTPGDPFLEPSTHGTVAESWDVLVVFNTTAPDRNLDAARRHSLRIRAAASRAGATWESTSGPRRVGGEDSAVALVENRVRFRYDPEPIQEATP